MRRALILAVLSALSLSPRRADAGVGLLNAVSSCPSVIKNAITAEMLLSGDFAPWGEAAGVVDTINTADIVNAGDTVDTVKHCVEPTQTGEHSSPLQHICEPVCRGELCSPAVSKDKINAVDTINQEPSEKKRRIKFGRRAAFNHSQVSNMLVRIYRHDGEGFSYAEYRNRAIFGVGFEAAGIIDVVLSDGEALVLDFSPGVVFRKPINTAVVGTSEVGLSVPAMLVWAPFGGGAGADRGGAASPDVFARSGLGRFEPRHLRLFGGVWAGAPLYARVKWNGEGSAPFKERSAADFGLICGAGLYVSDRAYVDARGIFGLSGYDRTAGRRLGQLAVGVNYVK